MNRIQFLGQMTERGILTTRRSMRKKNDVVGNELKGAGAEQIVFLAKRKLHAAEESLKMVMVVRDLAKVVKKEIMNENAEEELVAQDMEDQLWTNEPVGSRN